MGKSIDSRPVNGRWPWGGLDLAFCSPDSERSIHKGDSPRRFLLLFLSSNKFQLLLPQSQTDLPLHHTENRSYIVFQHGYLHQSRGQANAFGRLQLARLYDCRRGWFSCYYDCEYIDILPM